MSGLEDVFSLYEGSPSYGNCSHNNYNKKYSCGECWNNCWHYCKTKEVLPLTIGDQNTICDLRYKCYIRPGDECPICYEPILTKSNAFITNCGHSYHKKCLSKYMEVKWLSSGYMSPVLCPICRSSLGHPTFVQRYRSSYFTVGYKDDNQLDKLEDFWISYNYHIPLFCKNQFNHYLGMEKNCWSCKLYREKGEV